MGMKLRHTLHHRDQDRLHRKGRSGYMLTILPPPAPRSVQHHVERSPLSLPFLQWEERIWEGHSPSLPSVVGCLVGATTLWSCPKGTAGLNHWESDCEGEEGRGLQ